MIHKVSLTWFTPRKAHVKHALKQNALQKNYNIFWNTLQRMQTHSVHVWHSQQQDNLQNILKNTLFIDFSCQLTTFQMII